MTIEPSSSAVSAEAIADQVRSAQHPLRIVGGGTRAVGTSSGDALSLAALTDITLYEPGAMTMVARAGTSVAQINRTLAAEGQRLAFEPADWRGLLGTSGESTIGGLAAANVSGPRRIQVGACRDHMIGVEFVDGAGRVLKNGGRVMKNVTGYDLVKLLCGSWGTLGVLTELSFKVAAIPETEVTLVHEGLGVDAAIAKLCEAMGTPYDLSGSAHIAAAGAAKTCVRIEGLSSSVMYRRDALLQETCAGFDVLEGEASAALWADIRDVSAFSQREGAVWRVSLKPTDAPAFTTTLTNAGIACDAIYDWSGGLIWLLVRSEQSTAAALIRDTLKSLKGHATLMRTAPSLESVSTFQPQAAIIQNLEAGLRSKFDPRGILNPGLMG
jgi:glycolate oxidase FAD binding subunit